jgi:intracellular multiplication protein IcmV
MGVRNYVKNVFKANTNVGGWSDWSSIRSSAGFIKTLMDDVRVKPRTAEEAQILRQSFQAEVDRLGLTKAELLARQKTHFRIALMCFCLMAGAFGWFCHLFITGMIMSSLVALSVSILMGVYAVSQNFYSYRIKQERLNCTIGESLRSFFKK